jgi:hypothetical protein
MNLMTLPLEIRSNKALPTSDVAAFQSKILLGVLHCRGTRTVRTSAKSKTCTERSRSVQNPKSLTPESYTKDTNFYHHCVFSQLLAGTLWGVRDLEPDN